MAKKKPEQPMTMQQIADELKCKLRSVQKWRQKLKLGTPFNRTYLLTKADADLIGQHVQETRGNPTFGKPKTKPAVGRRKGKK